MASSHNLEERTGPAGHIGHPTADDIQRYIRCMEEIKRRYEVIEKFLFEGATTGFRITDAELICLQFRKVLELIALSSLCAHRKHYEDISSKFHKLWNAGEILNEIKRVNPHFYPVPTYQVLDQRTGKAVEWRSVESGFLTKDEFIRCYGACGILLHAENPYSRHHLNLEEWRGRFSDWYTKVMRLLNHHQIQLVDTDRLLVVLMKAQSDGKVHIAEFEVAGRSGPATPPPSPPPPAA